MAALVLTVLALPVVLMLVLMALVTAMPILALAILPAAVTAAGFTVWWRYDRRRDGARRTCKVMPLHRAP